MSSQLSSLPSVQAPSSVDSFLLSQAHELLSCAAHLNALMVGGFNIEDSLMCWTILPATNAETVKVYGQEMPTELCPAVIYWLKADLDALMHRVVAKSGTTSRRIRLAYQFTPELCKELAELSTNVMTGETTVPQIEMEYALAGFAAELHDVIDSNNPVGFVISAEYEIPLPYMAANQNLSLSVQ